MKNSGLNQDLNDALKNLSNSISQQIQNIDNDPIPIDGLTLYRSQEPQEPHACMYEPSICLVAQGSKSVTLGSHEYIYDPSRFARK